MQAEHQCKNWTLRDHRDLLTHGLHFSFDFSQELLIVSKFSFSSFPIYSFLFYVSVLQCVLCRIFFFAISIHLPHWWYSCKCKKGVFLENKTNFTIQTVSSCELSTSSSCAMSPDSPADSHMLGRNQLFCAAGTADQKCTLLSFAQPFYKKLLLFIHW